MSRGKELKKSSIVIPEFKSEEEEAAWWDANPDLIAEIFERAAAQGRVTRRAPTKTVAIRLPIDDIARARRLARKKGIGYQTFVKMLLHEALEREER